MFRSRYDKKKFDKINKKMKQLFVKHGRVIMGYYKLNGDLLTFGADKREGVAVRRPVILSSVSLASVLVLPCTSKKSGDKRKLSPENIKWKSKVIKENRIPAKTSYVDWKAEVIPFTQWDGDQWDEKNHCRKHKRTDPLGEIKDKNSMHEWLIKMQELDAVKENWLYKILVSN